MGRKLLFCFLAKKKLKIYTFHFLHFVPVFCFSFPHKFHMVIFQGPPGTGKTTSILALAHELLGPNFKEGVLELNASDERYISCS